MTSEDIRADYVWRTMEAMGTIWSDDHCGHVTRQMADEIARLRTRVAWLENEIDLIDGIATAATGLMNAPLDGRDLYIRKVIDAARTYRDGSLDDDGTEP